MLLCFSSSFLLLLFVCFLFTYFSISYLSFMYMFSLLTERPGERGGTVQLSGQCLLQAVPGESGSHENNCVMIQLSLGVFPRINYFLHIFMV